MQAELIRANESEHDTLLRNLYQLYLYEFSRFTEEWRVGDDGRFEESDLEDCWDDDHRRIYLIRAGEEWAGFAIVDLDLPDPGGFTVNVLAEFFIMPPYRRHGMGEAVARQLFDRFPSRWELTIVETNADALRFWRTILARYTGDNFAETHRPDDADYLHEFDNRVQ